MSMRLHTGWRSAIAQAAVFSLVLQALIGAFMMPSAHALPGAALWLDNSVCVTLAAGGGPQDVNPAGHGEPAGHKVCPVCAVLASSALAQAFQTPQLPAFERDVPRLSAAGKRPTGAIISGQRNRGPPFPA